MAIDGPPLPGARADSERENISDVKSELGSALRPALTSATERLAAAGVESARHDAEELAAYVLGVRRTELVRHDRIDGPALEALVDRRGPRQPLPDPARRA